MAESLIPTTPAPSKGARWCSRCHVWLERVVQHHVEAYELFGRLVGPFTYYKPMPNRCPSCRTALVRITRSEKPKKGEIRPGVVAEFSDPRDLAVSH